MPSVGHFNAHITAIMLAYNSLVPILDPELGLLPLADAFCSGLRRTVWQYTISAVNDVRAVSTHRVSKSFVLEPGGRPLLLGTGMGGWGSIVCD